MTNLKDLFRNTLQYKDKEITVEGWVKTVRDSKTFGFIELNDGSFFKNVQIVFTDKLDNFAKSSIATPEIPGSSNLDIPSLRCLSSRCSSA